ncbi:hypothetical protein L202_00878 [Cryptococcus amylolentus CBS 6039]|uniref:Uncharacterized protein n=2 Tax=Cryptococcus amylolentus TaxID=104669 RepID=A0A1E3I985_9TREE|nr:hypothetical protein L202_00878 [Cryptococcus amylolentus CBS 6039]ODN85048.1 hypothetical protein L202_00878 [Cryptococcus amylolentus CBS 6039]ODO11273.1 hypothetical protein I350_00048 [Cryptococcus amylolentus CBS 6273]
MEEGKVDVDLKDLLHLDPSIANPSNRYITLPSIAHPSITYPSTTYPSVANRSMLLVVLILRRMRKEKSHSALIVLFILSIPRPVWTV